MCRPIRTRSRSAGWDRPVGVEGALDRRSSDEHGGAGAGEGQHEAVALGLDLVAAVALEVTADDAVVESE